MRQIFVLDYLAGLTARYSGRRLATRLLPAAALWLGGCAIHPVQQDVTGVKTPDLVEYIRCETRLAVQDKAIELLEKETPNNPVVLQFLDNNRGKKWSPYFRTMMNAHERLIYDKYINTGIAYDFSFDITEDNSGTGLADPIKFITNGTAGIGLSASGDFKRENLRHFIVSETAKDLLENLQFPCPLDYVGPHYTYPISGTIGIKELISTFFDLNEIRPLIVDKSTSTVFADTLTFTTTVMGSVTPHVIVAPAGNSWGLASPASIMAGASRMDVHKLIIGLSLDTPKAKPAMAAAAVVPGYVARSALQRNGVRSLTEQSALDAIQQARIDAYLDRATH